MRLNPLREALKENINIAGLTVAAATSMATLSVVPLLAGAIAEVAYLLFVPDSRWYASRLTQRSQQNVEQLRKDRRDRILPTLHPELQQRYLRLEEVRQQVYSQCTEGETWYHDVVLKMDYLLDKFLVFGAREMEFRLYLRSVLQSVSDASRGSKRSREWANLPLPWDTRMSPDDEAASLDMSEAWARRTVRDVQNGYQRELDSLQQKTEQEEDLNTKAVLEKRLDVLRRRTEFVDKIGKILININHQLQLLEDTFGLINDEIRARSPEQIMADIDEVVVQADTMTQTLEEVAPYEQMAARMQSS